MKNPKSKLCPSVSHFDSDLKSGGAAERLFCELTGAELADGFDYDCYLPEGRYLDLSGKIECKVDKPDTDRFLIKHLGNIEKPWRVAGPWKARLLGITWYVIYKPARGRFYWFQPNDLVNLIEARWDSYLRILKKNQGRHEVFTSEAILVPQSDLLPLVRWITYVNEDEIEGL